MHARIQSTSWHPLMTSTQPPIHLHVPPLTVTRRRLLLSSGLLAIDDALYQVCQVKNYRRPHAHIPPTAAAAAADLTFEPLFEPLLSQMILALFFSYLYIVSWREVGPYWDESSDKLAYVNGWNVIFCIQCLLLQVRWAGVSTLGCQHPHQPTNPPSHQPANPLTHQPTD